MNKLPDHLALRKQLLQARSTLCRLRLRGEFNRLHDTLSWARAGVMAVSALPSPSAVLGLALVGVAHNRLGRWLALASRILLFARLARAAVNQFRKSA